MNEATTKTIAILGASTNREKFGNKAVRAYVDEGWRVIPVNPKAEAVEGIPAVATLDAIDGPVDRISVYLPPPVSLATLPAIAACDPEDVYFNPGSADAAVLEAARAAGIKAVDACSIVALGRTPKDYP